MKRCTWPSEDLLMIKYHDEEWGVPLHDDQKLFEFLILEGAQAGLTWRTVLHRREGYRKAFLNFDYSEVAKFTSEDVERLMQDSGIIRNRLKIKSAITNAQAFIEVRKKFGTFDKYIWSFVDGKVIDNKFTSLSDIPSMTSISNAMSKDLKKRGFKFVGSTICYAFMQATGMVNDHVLDCEFR